MLRRNRWESRLGRETTADLAYVDRTEDDATRSAPERKPPQVELGCQHSQQTTVARVVFGLLAVVLHSNEGVPLSEALMSCPVPNRGMAECPNRDRIYVDGVPRGRADTPGFYRQPEIEGQQVTEFGVSPLLQKNTQQEARIFGEGFLLFLRRCFTPSAHLRLLWIVANTSSCTMLVATGGFPHAAGEPCRKGV